MPRVGLLKNTGSNYILFFMVGFPWETEETLNETKQAMVKTKADVIDYSIFNPYPGTEMFELCKEKGLIDDSYDVSLYNHQSPNNSFCFYIEAERFRILAAEVERMVDKINARSKLRRSFSLETFHKVRELGVRRTFKRGMQIIRSVACT